MIYSIENDFLRVKISDVGAEIVSAVSKKDGCEFIWYGDEKYWTGHSPVMFPICGRLCEGKYTYAKKTYSLGGHGFARTSVFELQSASSSEVSLVLKSNNETKENYPFDFEFKMTYKLDKNAILMTFGVKNTDEKELIFAVGAHPAFNVPLSNGEKFEDYYVQFDTPSEAFQVDFSERCLCTEKDKLYGGQKTQTIDLKHDLFDNDAIFLYNIAKRVSLKSRKSDKSVVMTYPNMKYLGLWHKPKSDAPYVCIEPWMSVPSKDGEIDALETKKEMMHLPAGYSYSNTIKVELI
ncbi:MAG: aldose 1-epimerase family protein [Clostridia bacterium]|nr:aldose 1-epimerase family protein [Clostridia bacterium]